MAHVFYASACSSVFLYGFFPFCTLKMQLVYKMNAGIRVMQEYVYLSYYLLPVVMISFEALVRLVFEYFP